MNPAAFFYVFLLLLSYLGQVRWVPVREATRYAGSISLQSGSIRIPTGIFPLARIEDRP